MARHFIAFATALTISVLFSYKVKFPFEYALGSTWQYGDLYAPYDILIEKSAAEIDSMTAELNQHFPPVYVLEAQVVKESKAAFEKKFKKELDLAKKDNAFPDVARNTKTYLNYGNKFFDRLYEKGVISIDTQHLIQAKTDTKVIVLQGKLTQHTTFSKFLTLHAAREMISDSLPFSKLLEPEFLYELLEANLKTNIRYDDEESAKAKSVELQNFVRHQDTIKNGTLLVAKNSKISPWIFQRITSFKEQYTPDQQNMGNRVPIRFLSCFGILLGLFAAFLFILNNHYPFIFDNKNELNFIFITLLGYSFATFLITSFEDLSPFYLPFILLPLYLRGIVEKPLALLIHALNILAASLYVDAPNSFLAIQFIAGVAMLYVPMELKTTKDYTRLFLLVFGVYYVANLLFSTLVNGKADYTNWSFLVAILISFACTILLFPLVPWVDERIGIASEFTLRRLLDEDNVLLHQLAEKKPNVYLHARRVSYLASKVAKALRANALLVRVGGLYHDIGKITSEPSLDVSENFDAEQRALMHLQHISEGVRLAQQHRLPNNVIDFIVTHHGKVPIEGVTTSYPGPLPQTKEQAILMLVNACNSTDIDVTKETIEATITYLIEQEQFEESNLNAHELQQCKEILLNESFS